ncbi:MAG: hypothetical protein ACR2M1_15850 [Gemmatimonadaceae bacterium]
MRIRVTIAACVAAGTAVVVTTLPMVGAAQGVSPAFTSSSSGFYARDPASGMRPPGPLCYEGTATSSSTRGSAGNVFGAASGTSGFGALSGSSSVRTLGGSSVGGISYEGLAYDYFSDLITVNGPALPASVIFYFSPPGGAASTSFAGSGYGYVFKNLVLDATEESSYTYNKYAFADGTGGESIELKGFRADGSVRMPFTYGSPLGFTVSLVGIAQANADGPSTFSIEETFASVLNGIAFFDTDGNNIAGVDQISFLSGHEYTVIGADVTTTPEPSSTVLLATDLVAIVAMVRLRR